MQLDSTWEGESAMLRLLPLFVVLVFALQVNAIEWKQCLRQDAGWYSSDEAVRIADNVILFQRDTGGWPKNTDMTVKLSPDQIKDHVKKKPDRKECTIDNGATHTQLRYLAMVYQATTVERVRDSFIQGVEFLLDTQYKNGGWPQYPFREGYYSRVTFNDGAMIGVMRVLNDIANAKPPFEFVDDELRTRCARAVKAGLECILNCQIEVDGAKTVWCAQHDETTLAPAAARAYEKISLSGSESAGIVEFLMSIESPSPESQRAIHTAMAWFEKSAIHGVKVERKPDASLPRGYDKIVVKDASASPLWARFYEIETNRPIFCGRDGVVKYSLAEIEHERRVGYSWYSSSPAKLFDKYAKWKAIHE